MDNGHQSTPVLSGQETGWGKGTGEVELWGKVIADMIGLPCGLAEAEKNETGVPSRCGNYKALAQYTT